MHAKAQSKLARSRNILKNLPVSATTTELGIGVPVDEADDERESQAGRFDGSSAVGA